ncbi:hypothetical protein J2Z76_000430 [Sedimentibacter acidaminivorans]|uniref:Uncharacterized protein n=1 Tax=Sedimentibacter acidaminivorans TaxID=913099 RepID=A0ABS4GA59_9FIRM|nr:hypothetical protein [Sedimentibacter acidaminivorans]MBP1924577.1 hypothetical protein [Sedimentibacter acidaminivorans]
MNEIKEELLEAEAIHSDRELTLLQRFARLFSVKSLVTLTLTAVYAHLSIIGKVTTEQFMTIFVTVIAFYFGTQAKKE